MDNNNQNRGNGKKPSGQNIGVLAVIMLVTLVAVSMMNSALKKSRGIRADAGGRGD